MIIEKKQIADLIPAPYNPRQSTAKQEKHLKESLEKFGMVEPIIFNKQTGYIVGGHFRVRELKKLGIKEIECVIVDLNEDDEKELNIRLNANTGSWDWDTLANDWEVVDLEAWGLEIPQFDNEAEELEASEDDYDVPEGGIETDIVIGDLFEIGEHRLLCGDSTDSDAVARLMNGEKADMVFTDPPYNVGSETKGVASSSNNKQMKRLMESKWDKDFNVNDFLPNIDIFISENSTCYICTSHHLFGSIIEHLKLTFDFVSFCVWNKPNPMPSLMKRHWTWNTELICYATKGKHLFNFPDNGHALSVWTFTKVAKCDLHPTMKPISIPETAITHSSKINDIVLDAFLGSGSTMVAAHQLKRRCFGMELEPKYCAVIIDRMKKLDSTLIIKRNGIQI
jgi:DNA modification methylase